jgi:hypothetical protein
MRIDGKSADASLALNVGCRPSLLHAEAVIVHGDIRDVM